MTDPIEVALSRLMEYAPSSAQSEEVLSECGVSREDLHHFLVFLTHRAYELSGQRPPRTRRKAHKDTAYADSMGVAFFVGIEVGKMARGVVHG